MTIHRFEVARLGRTGRPVDRRRVLGGDLHPNARRRSRSTARRGSTPPASPPDPRRGVHAGRGRPTRRVRTAPGRKRRPRARRGRRSMTTWPRSSRNGRVLDASDGEGPWAVFDGAGELLAVYEPFGDGAGQASGRTAALNAVPTTNRPIALRRARRDRPHPVTVARRAGGHHHRRLRRRPPRSSSRHRSGSPASRGARRRVGRRHLRSSSGHVVRPESAPAAAHQHRAEAGAARSDRDRRRRRRAVRRGRRRPRPRSRSSSGCSSSVCGPG